MEGFDLFEINGRNEVIRPIMRICFIWTVLFLTILSAPAFAEDLKDIYIRAVRQDPQFLGAGYVHEASKETLRQAWAGLMPSISASGSYTETEQEIISSDNTVYGQGTSTFPTSEYTLSLTQPVFNYSSIVNVIRAKAEVRSADMKHEAARQELIIRIAEAYLGVLAAKDNLVFASAEETAVALHYELIKGKFNMGLVPKTDFLDAKARISEVKANRIAAESKVDDAKELLRSVTGSEVFSIAPLRETLPLVNPEPLDVDVWIASALKQNLDLATQRYAVEAARQEVRRQMGGHFPRIDAEASHNWRETEGTLFGGGSEVSTTSYLVRLNIPLFQGCEILSKTSEARNLYRAALQEEELQKREVKRQTRAAYFGVGSAIERVNALKDAVESQQLALKAREDGYRAGLFTTLAVLDAERDLYLARQNYANARYEYIMNSLKLRKALGTLNEKDIYTVNGWLVSEN